MSKYRRVNAKGGTYFFTVVTYRRQKFLCDDIVRVALRAGIQTTQMTHPFKINACVLLPDHLHCIWTLPSDDANTGVRWAMIKRNVTKICGPVLYCDELMTKSKQLRKESTVWQRRFWEHQILDDEDYRNHIDYIHYNPVKHNLVKCANDWLYSTFHSHVQKGVYTKNWGGNSIDSNEGFGE